MSKYDAGHLNFVALCIDGKNIAADHGALVAELDGTVVADMLREYAAHLAAQAEWPSVPMEGHTISVKSCDGEWEGEARWEHQEQAYVTQGAVRPPVGVVSDEDVKRACTAYVICANPDDDDEPISYVPARIRAALESYASRHAPTKE